MRFDRFSFGSLQIDGSIYEHDVVIDHGQTYRGNATDLWSAPAHMVDCR